MKTNLLSSIRLTLILILTLGFLYPLLIRGVAFLSNGNGDGERIYKNGVVTGFTEIGQSFGEDKYFWGRPSAVNYNASGSGASNKSIYNTEYIQTIKSRIDSFRIRNPGIRINKIPVELVTSSGSGLDPDISREAALIQIDRISRTRKIGKARLIKLVNEMTEQKFLGVFGPEKVNVLSINLELDKLK